MSKMTAFVAVDREGQKQGEEEMVKRSCPVPVATKEFSDGLAKSNVMYRGGPIRCDGVSLACNAVSTTCKV